MRGLLFGSASVFAFGTIVLAQSPIAPTQVQTLPPGQLGSGVQPAMPVPQKPLFPSAVPPGGVPQNNPGIPGSVTGTAAIKSRQPMSPGTDAIPPGSGNPIGEAATKLDPKPSIKASGLQAKPPSFPKKSELKAAVPPAEATMQPTKIGPGRPPDKSSASGGSGGGGGGGTPKGDSEQSAADKLKNLVPATKGPKLPVGTSKSEEQEGTTTGQFQTKSGKSVSEQEKSLGVGIGPAFAPPTTGKASAPAKADKPGSTDPAKGVEDKATARINRKDVPLPTSGGTISNDSKSGQP
jgi:hypothetical protein